MPPSPIGSEGQTSSFKRGYVACDGCRARKVRCVLGEKPPCAKCQREHRECVFQNIRKSGRHRQREAPKWTRGQGSVDHPCETTVAQSPQSTIVPTGQSTDSTGRRDADITDPVVSTFLARPSDALNVLFDAARPASSPLQASQPSHTRPWGTASPSAASMPYSNQNIIRNIAESGLISVSELSRPAEEVLDLWDRFRFVRQGWFTAQEAVTYIDLAYKYLAPLSPVLNDAFNDHALHHRLIVEEPLLCCTLLMITSRYFILPGAGGISRSHSIHQRIWQYCELLLRRIILGQEKMSTAKTRVLASIESLLLITDWHPRSLYLPPEVDGVDNELISPGYDRRNRLQVDHDAPLIRWREDVFEPAKRAERMSWMLLGIAVSLAFEMGVFSDATNSFKSDDPFELARARRIEKLLYIYVTRMSVNLGVSSLLPENLTVRASAPPPTETVSESMKQWELCMRLWEELTRLRKSASTMFFQSTAQTKQQLQSGNYSLLLEHFQPALHQWEDQFQSHLNDLPEGLAPIMAIEFRYLRTYTSALSIQAIVDRAVARNVGRYGDIPNEGLQSCILPQDYKFLAQVIAESTKVLQLATTMAESGRLRFAPHNTLLFITSSSVFVLKAISLGARNSDVQSSLGALDRCIHAMRSSPTDDMDFSIRYATLLERHVARFRDNLINPNRPEQTSDGARQPHSTLDGQLLSNGSGAAFTSMNEQPLDTMQHGVNGNNGSVTDFDSIRVASDDDWWACPFDPSIAPFSSDGESLSLRLEPDSLNFLWNIGLSGME